MNEAQLIFANEILGYENKEHMSISDLSASLSEHGIKCSQDEVEALFAHLKFTKSDSPDKITPLEVYSNGHLFRLDSEDRKHDKVRDVLNKIALSCGAGVTENDL